MDKTATNVTREVVRLDNSALYHDFVVQCPVDMCDRLEADLIALEQRFAHFITPNSIRHSMGLDSKR